MAAPNIKPFASDARNSTSYELSKPVVIHGYRYATDGAIAVRVPRKDKDSTVKFPKIWELFDRTDFSACVTPLPDLVKGIEPFSIAETCQCRLCEWNKDVLIINRRRFCPSYLAMVRTAFTNIKIGPHVNVGSGYALPFVADGKVQGLIMELAKEKRR